MNRCSRVPQIIGPGANLFPGFDGPPFECGRFGGRRGAPGVRDSLDGHLIIAAGDRNKCFQQVVLFPGSGLPEVHGHPIERHLQLVQSPSPGEHSDKPPVGRRDGALTISTQQAETAVTQFCHDHNRQAMAPLVKEKELI
jgi:hypothetical protein